MRGSDSIRAGLHRPGRWLAGAVLIIGACGNDDTTDPPRSTSDDSVAEAVVVTTLESNDSPDDSPCPTTGGTIDMAVGSEIARGLDPTVALGSGTAGSTELAAIYDTLMVYDATTGETTPNIAESLVGSADYTSWTLTLRDGLEFDSGRPFDAEAVRFNVERLAESTVAPAGMAQLIESIEVTDPTTLEFTLIQPWGGFGYFLASEGGMIADPSLIEEYGEEFATNATGAGIGPFEIERYAPGEELVLTARDDYWGGQICIDELRFSRVVGGQATFEAFDNGEFDVMFNLEPLPIAAAQAAGYPGFSSVNGGYSYLLNSGRGDSPVFADARLRQAVQLALDVVLIDQRVTDGTGLPGTELTAASQRINPGVAGLPFDPEAARGLVDAAMAEGFDGVVRLTGFNDPTSVERSIATQALLEDVGFEVIREDLPVAEALRKTLFEGDYDMTATALTIFDEAPNRGLNQFYSDSVRNRTGYADAELDVLLDAVYAAPDWDGLTSAMTALQEYWNEHVPVAVFGSMNWYLGWHDSVHGIVPSFASTAIFTDAYVQE